MTEKRLKPVSRPSQMQSATTDDVIKRLILRIEEIADNSDEDFWYLFRPTFELMCGEYDYRAIARKLHLAGYLYRQGKGLTIRPPITSWRERHEIKIVRINKQGRMIRFRNEAIDQVLKEIEMRAVCQDDCRWYLSWATFSMMCENDDRAMIIGKLLHTGCIGNSWTRRPPYRFWKSISNRGVFAIRKIPFPEAALGYC